MNPTTSNPTRESSRVWLVLVVIGLLWLQGVAARGQAHTGCYEVLSRVGDDPTWSTLGLDDSTWEKDDFFEVPHEPGVRWIRCRMVLAESSREALAVDISALASIEVFWDGISLGTNGVVGGEAGQELPGKLRSLHAIPTHLAKPGEHLVALRTSSHHTGFEPTSYFYGVRVGELGELSAQPLRAVSLPLLTLGGLVVVGLYFLFLFAVDRHDRSHLLLGLLSLTLASQLVAESWRTLFGYAYDLHIVRLRVVAALALLSGTLLVGFLGVRFRHPRVGLWGSVVVATGIAGWWTLAGYDAKTASSLLVALVISLWITGWAWIRRLPGSILAGSSVALCLAFLLCAPGSFLDVSWFYGMIGLLLCLLITQALQIRQQRRAHEAALVSSVRLELELLKKQLQPHFLMNTLTSLMELVEERPTEAKETLEALAVELRVLLSVSSQRFIPMGKELELCRAHLAVMSIRRDRQFLFETEGVVVERPVPPAVILTLVENAVTHNRYEEQQVFFRLQEEVRGEHLLYRFDSPLGRMGKKGAASEAAKGTGSRYVEARLLESFGEPCEMRSGPVGGFWQTTLTVPLVKGE
ncbi:MAG: histidine kinase [Deltaproteobacteria bacterium]|nr:histidine kinase [Deltaproteobacteria bacterium]